MPNTSKRSEKALAKSTVSQSCPSPSSESERIRISKGVGQEQNKTGGGDRQEDKPLAVIAATRNSSNLAPSYEVTAAVLVPNRLESGDVDMTMRQDSSSSLEITLAVPT